MKLEPKAKPVRIRIESGGEEHSTLESLKRNFSVDDLKPAVEDRRLSRWLKQQGQNELAEGVLRYQGKMKSLSGNDYLGFIKLFFANEPDIETVTDDYSLSSTAVFRSSTEKFLFNDSSVECSSPPDLIRIRTGFALGSNFIRQHYWNNIV